ncbi:hypothetical protein LTR99_002357 [Exophiala xenobiotica]|uniref:Uncharacterized protein n=1 Tax=Vermiconidia calcicola TaxID=1690605 RepID=A0AAV9QI30_9PEZI|nr:hypothetical protein H2202_000736 [Exophiala xenobiotica]KAK5541569.1 hypothetical protein LTR23_005891 [Chaetothyriales sp. CCFEE 6169]KAK5542305.1 hypothetical protein LTR25_002190 [Vermiconidia calcicola]KAK5195832.1 hypothetical protein LTR92_004773 [Exophiala xenobiotica]KAK5272963.1 hypothetical protein LTR96_002595 [Exophiala xenobiotica]
MITWEQFDSKQQDPDWRIELNEYNLFHFVGKGKTQLDRVFEARLDESAHGRQFIISQLGLRNDQFEAEHTARMEYALDIICGHFVNHKTNEDCRPTSPHNEELTHFRSSPHAFEPLPSFQLSDLLEVTQRSPSPTITSERSGRSPMSVQALMNPEVVEPSSRKRKHSESLSLVAITPDDSPEDLEVLETPPFLRTLPKYIRVHGATSVQTTNARLRRGARMRRSRSDRGHAKPDCPKNGQSETDGQLLLHFSRSH